MSEVERLPESETMKKLHILHLMLADELKRVCEKYNIQYFMIAGSLLGAVRHGGFIPWDDDMDFGILREDFEKFLIVCDQEIDGKVFYLQTERKEKYYPHNIAKLSLVGTDFKEDLLDKDNIHEGIYIDVFPIDTVSDSAVKKWFQFRIFYTARNLLRIKTGYVTQKMQKNMRFYIGRIIAPVFPIKLLKRVKHYSISRYAGMPSKYVVTSDGAYGLNKETLDRRWVETIRDYNFEDRVYPGIADCDAYLTYFYGDYMTPPREDDRNHHNRLFVNFGTYGDEG